MRTIIKILLLFFCAFTYAQTTLNGNVSDENGQPLPGANVIVVGTTNGAVTNFDGNFTLTVNQSPPFSVMASSVGFESSTQEITTNPQTINFTMVEGNALDEIIISASRTPERIFESPVTVERFGLKEIRNTASVDFYDGLENLKGVDVNTNSLTFKSVNTRGFATFANNRFMQLVDGMDNATPALNFPIGNLVGMIETDVQSVELLPGAASALYGANAFNGVLVMTSKSPFDHAGISAYYKQGITSQEASGDNTYTDFGMRLAYKFSDKFAAKVNFGYLKGTDWAANNTKDKLNRGFTRADADYDGINIYGDEVATPSPVNFDAIAIGLGLLPPGTVLMGAETISRTGYAESDLTDYNAESVKADWGLYYRPWGDDFEIAYVGKVGTGTTIYQGINRYNIDNFFQEQHKLEFKNDNFFLRGYVVSDKAGDSYDMTFTGVQINRAWKGDVAWFQDYTQAYIGTFLGTLGAGGTPNPNVIRQQARGFADIGRFEPGTPEFQGAFNRSINDPSLTTGSKFQDASKYYHADGNYNFSHLIDFADIQVGGSYRQYELNSSGTIYTDIDGPINYSEIGFYTQLQKTFLEEERLKLTASVRYDKSELFDGFVSPRVSLGYTAGEEKNHNIRASFQTGFRNPTTQDLYIGLDAGRGILVGSASDNPERDIRPYALSPLGMSVVGATSINFDGQGAYNNSFTASSAQAFGASAAAGAPDVSLLQIANPEFVKPEQVTSFEVGYRGKLDKVIVDFSVYYNSYKDFIANEDVAVPFYGLVDFSDGTITLPGLGPVPAAVAALAAGDFKGYQTYTNSDADVNSYGAAIGLSTKVFDGYDLGMNYTYAHLDFDEAKNPDVRTNFNTPDHKVKASFGNTSLFKDFGFNIAWRWSDTYFWQASFGDGVVPAYNTIDAQINLRVPSVKSTFKAGITNLLGNEYFTAFGTGLIGSQYYVAWTINNL